MKTDESGRWCEAQDGTSLWWDTVGEGDEAVVLVPGRGDASDIFPREEFRLRLVRAGLQVLSFDPRDTGLSADGGDTYTVATLAEDVVHVLDAADVRAAHVVGLSMAGLVLVDLAHRHADRVRSLTTISAMSPDPSAGFGDQLFAAPPEDPVRAVMDAMGSCDDADQVWVRARLAEAAERAPARSDAVERHNEAAFRGGWPELADLARITVPTLVVHGQMDRSLPLAHAHALAEGLPAATLEVIPGMGHLPRPADWRHIATTMSRRA